MNEISNTKNVSDEKNDEQSEELTFELNELTEESTLKDLI